MGNSTPHRARKRFGQHFLHDQTIISRLIAAIAPRTGDHLIEIGPGKGALTFPLLKQCSELTAVELDRDLIGYLQEGSKPYGQLTLINEDILKFELKSLDITPPYRLVGNLPYNISTPLMFHLLENAEIINDMHFMVQKEVAERIIARQNEKHYGRLSVMMNYYCNSEYLFDVPPQSFSPPPKVDSSIIRLIPHHSPMVKVDNIERLQLVVQSAFNQRRKTIGNSLSKLVEKSALEELGIDPRLRAENLSLEQFSQISNLKETA